MISDHETEHQHLAVAFATTDLAAETLRRRLPALELLVRQAEERELPERVARYREALDAAKAGAERLGREAERANAKLAKHAGEAPQS